MNTLKAFGSGLAGAVALTFLHQILKNKTDEAPRVDKLGMNAIALGFDKLGLTPPEEDPLFKSALAGDLFFNAIYYSFVAVGKNPLLSSGVLGLGAGLGAIALPGPLGLPEEYTNRTQTTKALTMTIYMFGAMVAGLSYKILNSKNSN